MNKVGKTTRLFRYDLNQIPYNFTVEVTNRFKGLDQIRVPEELWMEVRDIVQEAVIKPIPKKKKYKKAKCLSEKALPIAVERREVMKVKEESKRVGLKLNIQKTKIMASGPITSWEIDGETVETVSDYFGGLQNHCRW